jgi:hypothetical protein
MIAPTAVGVLVLAGVAMLRVGIRHEGTQLNHWRAESERRAAMQDHRIEQLAAVIERLEAEARMYRGTIAPGPYREHGVVGSGRDGGSGSRGGKVGGGRLRRWSGSSERRRGPCRRS